MTASVRDIAFKLSGYVENIEGAASDKQTAKIRKYLQELLEALDTRPVAQVATSATKGPTMTSAGNGADADLMAKVAELKRAGQAQAASGAGPVVMDAGPASSLVTVRKK